MSLPLHPGYALRALHALGVRGERIVIPITESWALASEIAANGGNDSVREQGTIIMGVRADRPIVVRAQTTIGNRIDRRVLEDTEVDAVTGGATSSAPHVYAIG